LTRTQVSGGSSVSTTYGYDNANRLTGITHSSSVAGTLMTLTYGYDAANQLTTYNGPEGTLTYTYDNDGQLTNVGGDRAETYSYDTNGNRNMSGWTTGTGNRLTADGTYTYSYDNDGNMVGRTRTSDSQVTTYTYDYRNRLTEVLIKTSGGVTVQDDRFTYDVENRRIGKNTLSGGQSWTGYDRVNPYADFNSGGSLTFRYLYGNAIDFLLGRVDTSGNAMWYLGDNLGSVRENVNASGTVLDSITYDSYGNILTESSPSSGDRFKFTGREWDSEIGQYYYKARYYGPGIGRFESEDSLGFRAGDSNFYRYVLNRPIYAADPTGLSATDPWHTVIVGPYALLLAAVNNAVANGNLELKPGQSAPDIAWEMFQQMLEKKKVQPSCEQYCQALADWAYIECIHKCHSLATLDACLHAVHAAKILCFDACLPKSGGPDNQEAGKEAFDKEMELVLGACEAEDLNHHKPGH